MAQSRSLSRSASPHRRHRERQKGDYSAHEHRGRGHHSMREKEYSRIRNQSRSPRQSPKGREDRRHYREPSPKRRRTEGARERPTPPALEVGKILQGRVRSVKAFGCFVELDGHSRDGLVHHSHISQDLSFQKEDEDADRVAAMEYFCPIGSKVWVKVIEIRQSDNGQRINCSMAAVDQDTGRDLDPTGSLTEGLQSKGRPRGRGAQENLSTEPPEIGSVLKARVVSIRPFGAFVQLEGYRANGLVHVSQISDHLGFEREDSDDVKVAALKEILSIDEAVFVKVVEVKPSEAGSDKGPKIGCSIKVVSQKDGTDWDPNNLKYKPRDNEGGQFGARAPVGANAGQVQHGNIDWGHLNAEKVNMDPRNADYEMLGSDKEDGGAGGDEPGYLPPPPKKGLKKQQKLQKSGFSSVEEAAAFLKAHKEQKKSKKKSKGKGKDKKSKKKKSSKEHKDRRKGSSSTSD